MTDTTPPDANHSPDDYALPPSKSKPKHWLLWLILAVIALPALWLMLSKNTPKPTPAVSAADTPKVHLPVVYAVDSWQAAPKLAAPFADTAALMAHLGVGATSDTALDWQGNEAPKYRFHALSAPPLAAVDSDDFFELNWYHATATDTDGDKALSQTYAQKAYTLSSAILGEADNRALFHALLNTPTEPIKATAKKDATAEAKSASQESVAKSADSAKEMTVSERDASTEQTVASAADAKQQADKKDKSAAEQTHQPKSKPAIPLPQGVVKADCQPYQCQLVFKK